ncbi:MAG: carbohydrate deacetylase [Actinomycetes bacterium]
MTAPPLLVVNADDFGLTPGVCEGILRAGAEGVVTSTSVLAVAPAFARYAPALRDSGLGVGCHVALVGEDPLLLGPSEVPTLVDASGHPPLRWREFLRRWLLRRVDPDDVRREAAAQLEACRAAGLVVDHLDSHQHVHLLPSVGAALVDLCTAEGVGAVRRPDADAGLQALGVRRLASRFVRRAQRAGVRMPAGFAGLDDAGHLGVDGMVGAVAALAAAGTPSAELGVHPGADPDPDRVRYEWGYDWPGELSALCDPRLREAVDRAGFRLGTFAELD